MILDRRKIFSIGLLILSGMLLGIIFSTAHGTWDTLIWVTNYESIFWASSVPGIEQRWQDLKTQAIPVVFAHSFCEYLADDICSGLVFTIVINELRKTSSFSRHLRFFVFGGMLGFLLTAVVISYPGEGLKTIQSVLLGKIVWLSLAGAVCLSAISVKASAAEALTT